MSIDKLTFQKWIAGTEIKFHKKRKPLKKVPGINQISALSNYEQDYVLAESIDLTRASNFMVQESSEEFLVASISLPLFGKKVIGNDTGLALACFDYVDREGETHKVIGVCAYSISGVGLKHREIRHSLAIALKK